MAQWVKNLPAVQETEETRVQAKVRKVLRRRKWQPTPEILPKKSHRQRSLAGYSSKGLKELDTTETDTHTGYGDATVSCIADWSVSAPGHGYVEDRTLSY